ncbi:MAG: CDP-2,3-bis-(O-geranylgeranyl)-sn-glycerol synthase [Candidatus Bathyarchaeota archaeon]|nr:CDP-2,3-bis-(O-geranylgeranyl)-sn-glycerol synthase [Candidatus Bathyarchaeota archaeon]MDH5686890.1 CDP-2,3-bis-(O-geranylgeranyl)-sn-glycerol synthase [Candidatus Bathyarchaeota archaeon]
MSAAVEVFNALYYIFPAYCANAAPVLFGGGHPMDFGRKFIDGKPIFGRNKTIRGFIAGLLIGTLVGWAQETLAPNIGLEKGSVLLGFSLSLGALFGDLIGSFVKRRLDLKPGASFPVSDQIDFVLLALLFSLPVKPPTFLYAVLIIALTLPIHLLANVIAYLIRVKKRPW